MGRNNEGKGKKRFQEQLQRTHGPNQGGIEAGEGDGDGWGGGVGRGVNADDCT